MVVQEIERPLVVPAIDAPTAQLKNPDMYITNLGVSSARAREKAGKLDEGDRERLNAYQGLSEGLRAAVQRGQTVTLRNNQVIRVTPIRS